jgi:two-component system response regulator DctR
MLCGDIAFTYQLFHLSEPMKNPVTVFVCDNDEDLRDGIRFMLQGKGFTVATYGSGPDLLQAVDAMTEPVRGVFVLDVHMEQAMDGPEVHAQLRSRGLGPKNPIIFLSGHGTIRIATDAVKLGALDFIEKPHADVRVVELLQRALTLEEQWQRNARRSDFLRDMWESLTPQQRLVATKAASGTVQRVIASDLSIGARMVEVHLSQAKEKLGVDTLAQLAATLTEMRECGIDCGQGGVSTEATN